MPEQRDSSSDEARLEAALKQLRIVRGRADAPVRTAVIDAVACTEAALDLEKGVEACR